MTDDEMARALKRELRDAIIGHIKLLTDWIYGERAKDCLECALSIIGVASIEDAPPHTLEAWAKTLLAQDKRNSHVRKPLSRSRRPDSADFSDAADLQPRRRAGVRSGVV